MKIVLVCGSPRKGNTEWMLSYLHERFLERGVESELILLRKKKIKNCNGCLRCEEGGRERNGICNIDDDMQSILNALVNADAIVLGTPVYFDMLSGMLKNFMDRTCAVWPKLEGKAAAGVAVAEDGIGQAINNINTYTSMCGMKWVGSVSTLAKKPRQVADNEEVMKKLDKLALALIADKG